MFGRDAQHSGRVGAVPAPFIRSELAGGRVTLRWAGNSVLQTANEANGPWADLAGATNGYQTSPLGPRRFYLLRSK